MIENIQIQKAASFGEMPENVLGLSKFNFVYGANGTGKATQRLASLYERKLAALEVLKKSLLHRAFTGQL
jgi:AAA15 family ATPase/GTPase